MATETTDTRLPAHLAGPGASYVKAAHYWLDRAMDGEKKRDELAAQLAAAERVVEAARALVAEIVPDTPFAGLESVDALMRALDAAQPAAPETTE